MTVPSPALSPEDLPLLGQDEVWSRLVGALDAGRDHHALLLEGPAGVGRSAFALRYAMAANCTTRRAPPADEGPGLFGAPAPPPASAPHAHAADGQPPWPCGRCRACRLTLRGEHPDVLHLSPDADKAVPVIKVEAVREVVRQSGYHRFSGARRVVIVDPAEALHPSAANALLKLLEEPPAGTVFVLVAASARGLLPTIVSRCQRTRLKPVAHDQLAAWLHARGVPEPERLARLSDGAPGRALDLAAGDLDARLSDRDAVLQAIAGDLQGLFDLAEAMGKGDGWRERTHRVLDTLEELLRDAVVAASAPGRPLEHDDLPHVAAAWAGALWPDGVDALARAVDEARGQLALHVSARLVLDALLARFATALGPARSAGR